MIGKGMTEESAALTLSMVEAAMLSSAWESAAYRVSDARVNLFQPHVIAPRLGRSE